jgi:hypothetical protein
MKKNNNFLEKIDFRQGNVTYNSFKLDECFSLENQLDELNEDMLQVTYGDRLTLDLGWRPYSNMSNRPTAQEGRFIVSVILDEDWIKPLCVFEPKTLSELKACLEKAIRLIVKKQEDFD